ncbi:hypothetical protein QCN27_18505 [Cereibacter sp. SYSU M97828]|nr:hypothetical protein [Cereibacter flavus]
MQHLKRRAINPSIFSREFHAMKTLLLAGVMLACAGAASAQLCNEFNTPEFFRGESLDPLFECLKDGVSLTQTDRDGYNLLMNAVIGGTADDVASLLQWLLRSGDKDVLQEMLGATVTHGWNVMHIAAENADADKIILLVSFGADVSVQNKAEGFVGFGSYPLHLAARHRDGAPAVAALLAFGADDIRDRLGRFAAQLAVTDDIRALLAMTTPGNRLPNDIEPAVADCSHYLTRKFFVDVTAEAAATCVTQAMPGAADSNGNTALHFAAELAQDSAIIDLIMQKVPVEDKEALVNRLNKDGLAPLHLAAQRTTQLGTIARLVGWGADPNLQVDRTDALAGWRAAHYAAARQDEDRRDIIMALIASGADMRVQDNAGFSPLHLVMATEPDPFVTTLVLEGESAQGWLIGARQLKVKSGPSEGATALHVAASHDVDYDTVETMLRYGFNPDAQDERGFTPLMTAAAWAKDASTFGLMLERSEDPCKETQGRSALALARANLALSTVDTSGQHVSGVAMIEGRCR